MKTTTKRWALGTGAVSVAVGTVLGVASLSPAAAGSAPGSSARSIQGEQVSLRLAADPNQVANVKGGSREEAAQVIQWPWSGQANERWKVEAVGDHYRFRSVNSDKCLNVRGGGNEDNTPVIQYTCGTAANELWSLVPKGNGYQLVAKSSGKCLNVRGGVGEGRDLIQYTCTSNGVANDVWLPVWEPTRP